ncbi:MAG: hypothetical protein ACOC3W_06550 [Thermodesulfobacteriota bacterium]
MSIYPTGEGIRKAVRWISEERKYDPDKNVKKLVREAVEKFNLSPKDAEFLDRFVKDDKNLDV